jgi:hypothetical protein
MTLTDCAFRTFKNITVFQYAVWAKDSYMASMMLTHFNKLNLIGGLNLAKQQLDLIELYGLNYTYHDARFGIMKEIQGEKNFDFSIIIKKLDEYADVRKNTYGSVHNDYWCHKVGAAQRELPAHVVQEYCDTSKAFYGQQTFKNNDFNRHVKFDQWCGRVGGVTNFYPLSLSDIGETFAICRVHKQNGYEYQREVRGVAGYDALSASNEADAIDALCKARTQDIRDIKAYLTNPEKNILPDHLANQMTLALSMINQIKNKL